MAEPVTIAEAKAQCNMTDDNSQDTFLTALIAPARAYVERVTGMAFVAATRTETFNRWGDYLELWRKPIASITSVKYSISDVPADDVAYTGFAYSLNSYPVRIYPALGGAGFPELETGQTITVVYVTSTVDAATEEYLIGKRAMLLLIGHWFENRETVAVGFVSTEVHFAVTELLNTIRPVSAY